MTDTITLPRSVVAGALHALDLSQALLESSKSIHHTTILEEYKALRAALAQQAEQGWIDASKQMPPAQVRVLGFEPQYNIVDVDMWFGPDFQWGYSYWMPLPTPPKGGV